MFSLIRAQAASRLGESDSHPKSFVCWRALSFSSKRERAYGNIREITRSFSNHALYFSQKASVLLKTKWKSKHLVGATLNHRATGSGASRLGKLFFDFPIGFWIPVIDFCVSNFFILLNMKLNPHSKHKSNSSDFLIQFVWFVFIYWHSSGFPAQSILFQSKVIFLLKRALFFFKNRARFGKHKGNQNI